MTTDDDGLVENPIADMMLHRVPPEHAEMTAPFAKDYLLIWRAAACIVSCNWPGADAALAEADIDDHRGSEMFKTAVHCLATLALYAGGGEEHAEAYFTQLIEHQHRIDAKRGK